MSKDELALKKRAREIAVKYAVLLCIGTAYLVFCKCTGFGIPCVFYKLTGLKCAGCGITRMLVSIAGLDLASAFGYNPFLFVTGPFLIAYLACSEIKYVITGSGRMGKWEIFLLIELILAIGYWILRNIFPI